MNFFFVFILYLIFFCSPMATSLLVVVLIELLSYFSLNCMHLHSDCMFVGVYSYCSMKCFHSSWQLVCFYYDLRINFRWFLLFLLLLLLSFVFAVCFNNSFSIMVPCSRAIWCCLYVSIYTAIFIFMTFFAARWQILVVRPSIRPIVCHVTSI